MSSSINLKWLNFWVVRLKLTSKCHILLLKLHTWQFYYILISPSENFRLTEVLPDVLLDLHLEVLEVLTSSDYTLVIPTLLQGDDQSTSNILVRWSGQVGAVSGFALSLTLRDRIREIVRQFPMPREPRIKASVTAGTGPGPGKITLITAREDDSTHTGREITRI